LIVHGSRDESVPPSEGERLKSASRAAELKLIDTNHSFGAVHPFAGASAALEEAGAATAAFFREHLG
jgi:hypothetical protein